ncbi:hypothetical protein OSB04_010707 [Centaurea solstitialis]|uniref:Phytocyanin domain-containing protein n=1 Tax=Centaurea solstitialis TaxID=347529 RepID=A0AA38T836_9ASTR|nr:hypothetical protein OSB04_010707 [Centaurea solstitialis]
MGHHLPLSNVSNSIYFFGSGKEILVGDDKGWTMNFDYQAWANGKEFYVGDTLGIYNIYRFQIIRHQPAETTFLHLKLYNKTSAFAVKVSNFFLPSTYIAAKFLNVRTRTKPICKNEGTNKITRDFVHGRPLATHPLTLSERGLHTFFPSQHKITCDFLGFFVLANWVVLGKVQMRNISI